jgi:hypothetical protein
MDDGQDGGGGVQLKRLVRFRLCPTDTCQNRKDVGCNYRYGDYVVSLETFVSIYYEHKKQLDETMCEQYLQGSCDCSGEGNQEAEKEEDFDANQCIYDCYAKAGLANLCMGDSGYDGQSYFDAEQYMQCTELQWPNNSNNDNNANAEQQGMGLYIGPYCTNQGRSISLGMFTDADCTELVDNSKGRTTFKSLTGMTLPYSNENIVTMDCLSCVEKSSDNNNESSKNTNVAEMCQQVYSTAGKCEKNIPEGIVSNRDSKACTYITSIQKMGQYGIVGNTNSGPGAGITFFIVLLVTILLGMVMYVHYLRTRLIATEALKRRAFLDEQYMAPPDYHLPQVH